jgi:ABC-2 type transport system permease protein
MGRHLRLIGAFLRIAVQRETSFRTNLLFDLLNTVLNLVAGIAGLGVLFGQVDTIRGWTYPEALAVLGVFLLVGALRDLCIGPSLSALGGLGGEVFEGRFDFTLLKPVSPQFMVSVRVWRLWALGDLLLGLIVLAIALVQLGDAITFTALVTFVAALLISLVIVYAMLLTLESVVFWYRGVPLEWIFDSLAQTGRYPVSIYPAWLALVLTWVVPVAFITSVPAEALVGQTSPTSLLGGAALAVVLLVGSSLFFRASLQRYSSASS